MTVTQRKQYALLDVLKFFLIAAILFSHTANEHAHLTGLWHYVLGIYNFGVPFCFACSGYLFFSKVQKLSRQEQSEYYKSYSIRLGRMYLAWSVIYLTFVFIKWSIYGITEAKVIDSVCGWLTYSTYPTIWFIPALWVGISIAYWLWRNMNIRVLLCIALILYVLGNLFGSYRNLVCSNETLSTIYDIYISVFKTFRNGLFNGMPFVTLGLIVANGKYIPRKVVYNVFLTLLFFLLVVIECAAIKFLSLSTMTDMPFTMAPAIFSLLLCAIQIEVKYNSVFLWMRNLSMLVFLGQRIFLSAIPDVSELYSKWIECMTQLEIMLALPGLVFIFSWFILLLSKKVPVLKILW